MADIKLIAVDLDGTLLRSDGTPCPYGLKALRAASATGTKIIISTVRRYVDTDDSLYAKLGFQDPLICSDGSEIYSSFGGDLWHSSGIPIDIAREILELADQESFEVSVGYPGINYWKKRNKHDMAPSRIRFTDSYAETLEIEPVRIITSNRSAMRAIQDLCRQYNPAEVRVQVFLNGDGTQHAIGLFPPHTDKGTAFAYVCDRVEIPISNTMAIGDSAVDVPMLKNAGVAIAMGNARDDVKEIADDIAPICDSQGVRWAIESYLDLDRSAGQHS